MQITLVLEILAGDLILSKKTTQKHTPTLFFKYLKTKEKEKARKIRIWPPQSPDLIPIERLWNEMDRTIRMMATTNIFEIFGVVCMISGGTRATKH